MVSDSSGSKLRAPVTLLGNDKYKVQAVSKPDGKYGTDLVIVPGAPTDLRKLVEGLKIPEGTKLLDLGLGTDLEVNPASTRRFKDATVTMKRKGDDGSEIAPEVYALPALLNAMSLMRVSVVTYDGEGNPLTPPAGVMELKDVQGQDHCLVMRLDTNEGYKDPYLLPGQLMVELVKDMLRVEAQDDKFNLGLKGENLRKLEKVIPNLKGLLEEPKGLEKLFPKKPQPGDSLKRYKAMKELCLRLARYMGDKDAVEKARPKEAEGSNDWRKDMKYYDEGRDEGYFESNWYIPPFYIGVPGTFRDLNGFLPWVVRTEKVGSYITHSLKKDNDIIYPEFNKFVVPNCSGTQISNKHLVLEAIDHASFRMKNVSGNKQCNAYYLTDDERWAQLVGEHTFQAGQAVCLQIRDKKGKEAMAIIVDTIPGPGPDYVAHLGEVRLGYRDMKKRPLLLEEIEAGKTAKREKVEAAKAMADAETAKAARIKQEAEEKARLVAQELAKMSEMERQIAALRAEQREIEDKQLLSKAEEKGWISLKNAPPEKKAEILEKMRKESGEVKYDHIVAIPDPWGKELVIGRAFDSSEPINQLEQTGDKFKLSIIPDEDPPEGLPKDAKRRISSTELRVAIRGGTICVAEPEEYRRYYDERYVYSKGPDGKWSHLKYNGDNKFTYASQPPYVQDTVAEVGIRDYNQTDEQVRTEGPKHRIRVSFVYISGKKDKLIVEW